MPISDSASFWHIYNSPIDNRPVELIAAAVSLGITTSAYLIVALRQSMQNTLEKDFIIQARMKGVSARRVIWKHALPNAVLPPSKLASPILMALITNTVVLEAVFGWRGVGHMVAQAVWVNDYPVLLAAFMLFLVMCVVVMLTLDVLYACVDPRIRRPQHLPKGATTWH